MLTSLGDRDLPGLLTVAGSSWPVLDECTFDHPECSRIRQCCLVDMCKHSGPYGVGIEGEDLCGWLCSVLGRGKDVFEAGFPPYLHSVPTTVGAPSE